MSTTASTHEDGQSVQNEPQPKKKREKKEAAALTREAGKFTLPFSRVQKIVKADKDIPIIAKDATFLISLATEEFIKRLSEAGQKVAEREKRTTVQHKDIATVVRKADEFVFLEEIISSAEPAPKRKPKALSGASRGEGTLLEQFMRREGETDVVVNADGTMSARMAED